MGGHKMGKVNEKDKVETNSKRQTQIIKKEIR